MNTRDAIDETIERLRSLIEQAVRNEQLRHQLTGLPNQGALDEGIQGAIGREQPFWLAFIEIDRFKTINDRFGYELADALLIEVAKSPAQMAPRYFATHAVAFHAHGDEFYVLGVTGTTFSHDEIGRKLDAMRAAIASIALPAGPSEELMKCTVSIGWSESRSGTARELMRDVELAVAHAKRRGRDCVAMFDESMRREPVVSLRSDCKGCKASFSVEIPMVSSAIGDVFCPNCGTPGPRPGHAAKAPEPKDITDLPSRLPPG